MGRISTFFNGLMKMKENQKEIERLTKAVESLDKIAQTKSLNTHHNVLKESEYKERVEVVFAEVAEILSNTLGPYGATTIMEKNPDITFSKDGWQVLKKIAFEDNIMNTLLGLLIKISAQVNIKVGDGTTTSIVSANEILKAISSKEELKELRPKDLLDKLNEVVCTLCDVIQGNATPIDKDGNLDEIYKLALVSTNGEVPIADMIQTIYTETGNPVIEYDKAKSNVTSYEVVEGYKMPFMTYIDRLFINNDNATCNLNNPLILMIDHRIESDYYETILQPTIGAAIQQSRRVVIMAPYYDTHLMQRFSIELMREFKATKKTTAVYVRPSLMNAHLEDLYNDFAALTGCTIIKETIADGILKGEIQYDPNEYLGTVSEMSIGEQSTFISGFHNMDEGMLDLLKKDAQAKYDDSYAASQTVGIISEGAINSKQRLAKLRGKMGIISVGGNTESAKEANYDLVEDAVKACESAYNFGMVPGQNIAIQTAISLLMESAEEDPTSKAILEAIHDAFVNVTKILIENKFKDADIESGMVEEVVKNCVINQWVTDINTTTYDLTKDAYNFTFTDSVVNSCKTDIEILKAATSIIGLLLSSNQYVAIRM